MNYFKKLSYTLLLASLFATACSDDKKETDKSTTIPADYLTLPGAPGSLISENQTWRNDTVLTGPRFVLPGVTLTIEAGVEVAFTFHDNDVTKVGMIVTLKGDAENFSTPQPSGRLVAEGTANNPVVFTSARTTKAPGDWGGIILIGEAYNNIPNGLGAVEGLPNAVAYGATTPKNNDDSGVLKYVRIEYCGFGLEQDSEVNGLSLYSVGSATTLEYVQVYKCTDDGFEWFGGTVSGKYLISAFNDDDSFDMDEGWSGNGQFWLAVQSQGADNGFESDGRKELGVGNATNPTLYNVTLVGFRGTGVEKDAADKNYGMRLREDFEGELRNFIIADFWDLAYKLESASGDVTASNFGTALTMANFDIYNNKAFESTDAVTYANVNNALSASPFTNQAAFNFVPTTVTTGATPPNDGFFTTSATHVGAFGTTNWATGNWVRFQD
jgi:hypothetical protein